MADKQHTNAARSQQLDQFDPSQEFAKLDALPLRRRNEPEVDVHLGPAAKELFATFSRILRGQKSEATLIWPQKLDDAAILHALVALTRIDHCTNQRLATLFFPWNRNTGASEKTLLVDRERLVKITLPLLGKIMSEKPQNPAFSYLMALHSLKHLLSSGKENKRLKAALENNPGLVHPSLFEIMPQIGIQESGARSNQDQFLGRLRKHTWIDRQQEHVEAAANPIQTPFVLFGVHTSATRMRQWRDAGLDPKHEGRQPDFILIDLMYRARGRLGSNWRQTVTRFLGVARDLYGTQCPPVFALTDDVFVLQALRWEILKEYDVYRGALTPDKRPVRARITLNPRSDPFDQEAIVPGALTEVTAEVYSTDILSFVEHGFKLRRALLDGGDAELAEAVGGAIDVLQNLIGLPGPPNQLQQFLSENYEGYELHSKGARYDHLTPRGKIKSALQNGLAGANHKQLNEFLDAYDKLCSATVTHNPGHKLFDECVHGLIHKSTRSILVFSNELLRSFAEWRIETEDDLKVVRPHVGRKIRLVDRREAVDELEFSRVEQQLFRRIIFIEPHHDDFLHVLTRPWLPEKVVVIAHLARIENTLRRIKILLQLDGVEPIKEKLLIVEKEFQRALQGRSIDIPDIDAAPAPPRFGTLDLTAGSNQGSGPTRIIATSGELRIRAYDGSTFALYQPEALQPFTRKLAKDLQPDDQICVFSPDFVDAAREKLNLTSNASEILVLYHKAVAEAAANLPGSDIASKAKALRERILQNDPSLDLPGIQSVRGWIDVVSLIDAPRNEVRPHAPGDRRHYLCFMKALGIADDVARNYWDLGVFWTRSMRISKGAEFHQVFMGILIDPHGAASKLPAKSRAEVWRICETAEQHTVRVISNEREGKENENS